MDLGTINENCVNMWTVVTTLTVLLMGLTSLGFYKVGKGAGILFPLILAVITAFAGHAIFHGYAFYNLQTYDYWAGFWGLSGLAFWIILVNAFLMGVGFGFLVWAFSEDGQSYGSLSDDGQKWTAWLGRFIGTGFSIVFLIVIGIEMISAGAIPPNYNAPGVDGMDHSPQCDQSTMMAHLLPVTNANSSEFLSGNSDVDHTIVVAEETAATNSSVSLGSVPGLTTYLETMTPYLTQVQINKDAKHPAYHYYWVTGLQVPENSGQTSKQNQAWKDHGKVSPGFLIEDAQSPGADILRTGYSIKYVPNAWGLNGESDPYRAVYFGWLMKGHEQYVIDKDSLLGGLELDYNLQPYYTTTYSEHVLGTTVDKVQGILTLNAQTGEIKQYPFDASGHPYEDHNIVDDNGKLLQKANADAQHSALPAWVQHPYSGSYLNDRVRWWGYWNVHCSSAGTGDSDRYRYVNKGIVVTAKGLMEEYDFTSLNADRTLSFLLFVSLRNGEAYKVNLPVASPTSDFVHQQFVSKSQPLGQGHVDAINGVIVPLNGKYVWLFDIVSANGSEQTNGAAVGYGFVVADWARSQEAYVVDSDLSAAYNKLADMIKAGGPGGTPAFCTSGDPYKVTAHVTSIHEYDKGGNTYVMFTLDAKGGYAGAVWQAPASQQSLFMQVGDSVTVTFTCFIKAANGVTDVSGVFDNRPGFPSAG